MKYSPYPVYIPMRDETNFEYPKHWKMMRLRYAIDSNPVKSEVAKLNSDTLVSFVPMEAVGENGEMVLDKEKCLKEVYNGYTYFRDYDVVFAKITPCFENGKGAIAKNLINRIGFGTTEFHVLRAREITNSRWLFYLTKTAVFRRFGESEMYGAGGQKRVPESFIKNFTLGLPPIEEQKQIADFIDYKTAQIDLLIKKKKELIEKLNEKRIALITKAVTKGLDPTVKMKDSGVDWLGEVPEHWEVRRTKFNVSYIGSGKTPNGGANVYVKDGIMLLRSQNVYDDGLRLSDVVFITDEADSQQANSRVMPEDVLLNITGASIGRSSIVPLDMSPSNVNQHVCILRPVKDIILPGYLHLLLCSTLAKEQVQLLQTGTSREGLNFVQVADLLFPLPNRSEQNKIVKYCTSANKALAAMIEKVTKVINYLEEYRSALITASVTGKIDVRNIEIPSKSSTPEHCLAGAS